METTLIILKPDAVQRNLCGRIIGRFEDKGLQIVGLKLMTISQELAAQHYSVHKGKPFYDGLVRFMTSAPVMPLALRGINAIDVCRKMTGATYGSEAESGTIRGDFGLSKTFNLIHASDGPETAAREVSLFFSKDELFEQEPAEGQWIYDMSSGSAV